MISSAYTGQWTPPQASLPDQDPAWGLAGSAQVLELGGAIGLTANEAPRLSQAAGGQLVALDVLQAQVEDAARVVAAADPASVALVQRVRASTAALAQPPEEPISNAFLNGLAIFGGILGMVLGILPAFGFLISPWFAVGVLALSVVPYGAQLYNSSAVTRTRERQVADHEEGILALLRRADELRLMLAQQQQQARQTAYVTLDAPQLPAQ